MSFASGAADQELALSLTREGVIVMRKLTARDAWATLIVAAVVIPFIGYSARGSWPLVEDPRGMAGVGIVGALLAVWAFGRGVFRSGTFGAVMTALAAVAVGFGLAALIAENTWALLVPMVAGLVAVWLLGVLHDAGGFTGRAIRHG